MEQYLISALAKAQGCSNKPEEGELIKSLLKRNFRSNQNSKKTEVDRFFEKIAFGLSDCWFWIGCKDGSGYGRILTKKENFAHRLSWRLFNGKIPTNKKVLHHCDVPCCVNPDHLYLGDQFDNMRDMMSRNRHKPNSMKGEKHPLHKLSQKEVDWIREIYLDGNFSYKLLAKMLGVTKMTVCRANLKQSWSS